VALSASAIFLSPFFFFFRLLEGDAKVDKIDSYFCDTDAGWATLGCAMPD